MRFRATIDNVPTFYKLVQAIEKLQKRCVVKFTESDMQVICASEVNEGGIQVWAQVRVSSLFVDYRIQSNAGNQITVILSSEALLAALRSSSAQGSTSSNTALSDIEVVMKLAKKNDQAVLSFEMTALSRTGGRVQVVHDIRIEVMKPQDVERLVEPLCPEPQVHILLPPLLKLRTIVERLKAQSDIIGVRASKSGDLVLSLGTDNVKTDVSWTGLNNPTMVKDVVITQDEPTQGSQTSNRSRLFGVMVSVKSFLKFLNSHVISTTTIACLCQNHCIILYVYIGEVADAGGVLTFYLPAILEDSL